MKVITIANYPKDDNYYRMFLAWVVHNHDYMSECEVQICYAGNRKNMIFSDECQKLLAQFKNITFKETTDSYSIDMFLRYLRNINEK